MKDQGHEEARVRVEGPCTSEARPSARRHHCTACGISHSGASSCDAANACSTCAGDGKVIPFRSVEDYPETEANPCPRCEGTGLTERYRRWRAGERMNEAELCACPYGSPCALHPRTTEAVTYDHGSAGYHTAPLTIEELQEIANALDDVHKNVRGSIWSEENQARYGRRDQVFARHGRSLFEEVLRVRKLHPAGIAQGVAPCTDYPGHNGCEARRKLGIARGVLESVRQEIEGVADEFAKGEIRDTLGYVIAEIEAGITESAMPHVECSETPVALPRLGQYVHVGGGPHTGATGRLDYVTPDGEQCLVDFGGGRKGGLTWVKKEWLPGLALTPPETGGTEQ